jgi:hypothetical protein
MTLFARFGNGGLGDGGNCAAGAAAGAAVCAGCGALDVCGWALATCGCAPALSGTASSARRTDDARVTPLSLLEPIDQATVVATWPLFDFPTRPQGR